MQQCRELLAARDLWSQVEAAAPGAAAELKQLAGILAGVEASCPPAPMLFCCGLQAAGLRRMQQCMPGNPVYGQLLCCQKAVEARAHAAWLWRSLHW